MLRNVTSVTSGWGHFNELNLVTVQVYKDLPLGWVILPYAHFSTFNK